MMFLCAGGCASVRLRFLQLRGLGKAVRQVFGRSKDESGDGISSFEASSAALAGAVGTGNIAGVAGAIALGGPGAVFWMWVSAILGMATKYAEIFLAVKYRDGRMGGWLRNSGEHLFPLFCLFGASAAMGVGALVQSSTLAEAVAESAGDGPLWLRPVLGISAAVITGMVVSGGAKGVGKLSALLMPLMGGLYVLGAVLAPKWKECRHMPKVLRHRQKGIEVSISPTRPRSSYASQNSRTWSLQQTSWRSDTLYSNCNR